ncbi:NAD(P)-dependent dehydrogenase, short-chain alcohol dehydrogenase family [Sulfitobacter brevis]|uniref:NAD(P)-dependent dehydrogenase, short-chain alcohol dehydrogenase family n=1 Tax=Sulfitobacter brevis TaxID=74348 RepID=A0A1I2BDH9_9RHOB|nr:SDR family oxidoreductase [Sulfitobacter brevis]SFE54221.1 NAD(P)-dependent dehydrogenase, short-chain alcohol dehydrogenase family [Sulfitobacter brevis]
MTKTAVITGGASGIGRACAQHFMREGWNVVLSFFLDSEKVAADALEQEAARLGVQAVALKSDVTKDEDCRELAALATMTFGRIDALVSCAGTTRMVPHADLDALTMDDFMLTTAVNTVGPFQIVRACADALKAGDGGSVVIVSSYGAIWGTGSSIAYAASKGATNTLTMSLARVLAPKVRVNAVCPALIAGGFVERMNKQVFDARVELQEARAPLQLVGQPEDVAADVYWLSTGARLMTGTVLSLDSGLHLNGDS